MKFGEKYELLESLTTGGVETFVANDKIRGERVLVHILECEAQKANQPTVQWVLEAFRRIAPEPAALVLETGRYSGTLYAYLVTKMPEESALIKWVRMYKAQWHDTQEIPAPAPKPSAESEAPTANLTPREPLRPPASVTELFRDFDANANAAPSGVPSKATEPPRQPPPNAGASALHPAPGWDAMTPQIPPAKTGPKVSSPESSFSSAFGPRNFSSETNSPIEKERPKPGEFTSFFQGPFRADRPSEMPAVSTQPTEPQRKTVGDFTAMFNPPRSEEPLPGSGAGGLESPGTGFTGLFSPNIAARTPASPQPSGLQRSVIDDMAAFPAPSKEPFIPPQPVPYVPPTPVVSIPLPPIVQPPLPSPGIEKQRTPSPNNSVLDGATYAFNRPAGPSAPPQPAVPSGPSPYTQVISVRSPAGPAGAPKEPSAAAPGFPAAVMPPLPAVTPPAMPAAPPMPKMAVPPAPKAPKVAAPEPPVSYWPLILTLTVLFFIAVLLVLYFALRH